MLSEHSRQTEVGTVYSSHALGLPPYRCKGEHPRSQCKELTSLSQEPGGIASAAYTSILKVGGVA